MGRANLGLKEYDKARECYKKALECDPKNEGMIKGIVKWALARQNQQNYKGAQSDPSSLCALWVVKHTSLFKVDSEDCSDWADA